eukprot:c2320_g1_i1.p1 GENE.c2320_g1_i1~~c2320_g1_i1.p1  ORF type:complete len:328 (+),score=60.91 c2320_g1_i1:52-1035(+)
MRAFVVLVFLVLAGLATSSVPTEDAQLLSFVDVDLRSGYIAGTAYITRAADESSIKFYVVYFSSNTSDPAYKLQLDLGYPHRAVVDNIPLPSTKNPAHPTGKIAVLIPPIQVPSNAWSLVVISKNAAGEKDETSCILDIVDVTSAPVPLCQNMTFTHPSGAFDDGSGDSNYTSAVDKGPYNCVWTISNTDVSKFLFRVTYLELDPYFYDSLCVYETDGTKLECYNQSTGASKPYNVVSKSNRISVVLSVSGSISGGGFRAVYYGLDAKDFQNSNDGSVMKIRYDQDYPLNCHCLDVSCQADSSNCFVDEGNGKGWSTCANLGTCNDS